MKTSSESTPQKQVVDGWVVVVMDDDEATGADESGVNGEGGKCRRRCPVFYLRE